MEVVVGASDAIAGMALDELVSCDAMWISSFELSSALGLPDDDRLTYGDIERVAISLSRVTAKGIHVDIGNGSSAPPENLENLANRVENQLNFVVDDTTYPRQNSFARGSGKVGVLAPEEAADRWRPYLDVAASCPNVSVTVRSERCSNRAEGLTVGAQSLALGLRLLSHRPSYVLVHRVDFLDPVVRSHLRDTIQHPFMVLSTLSPRATVDDFRLAGADCLVIPNVLTVARHQRSAFIIGEILSGRTSVSWLLPTFQEYFAARNK